MREVDAGFPPGELEAFEMRGEQIQQQHRADEIAAGKNRRHPPDVARFAQDKVAAKPARLPVPQALVDLRERAEEDEGDGKAERPDG